MAIWYAQRAGNINDVSGTTVSNVWNSAADGSGSWMDVSPAPSVSPLFAGGTDTVLVPHSATTGYAVTINVSIDIGTGRLSTAAEGATVADAQGGGFALSNSGITVTANILCGTTNCLTISGANTTTIKADTITGSATLTTTASAIRHTGSAVCTLIGNTSTLEITGGGLATSSGVYDISTTASGGFAITGNITGGAGSYGSCYGLYIGSSGSSTLTGNVTGGSIAGSNFGCMCSGSSGFLTVNRGNLINNLIACACSGKIIYNPGINNYIEYPYHTDMGDVYKYGKTIPAASVASGVDGTGISAPATGTLVASSSSSFGRRTLVR